jgi:hypothetical protein
MWESVGKNILDIAVGEWSQMWSKRGRKIMDDRQ